MRISRIGALIRRAFGLALVLCAAAGAQSHDPKKPTPLGSGVNKGNVDNTGNGPNYYYLWAGPGHVEMHYAFHEMGVFGNPFKQVLNFDIIDWEKNESLSHDPIQSIGKLERFTRSGDLKRPYKLLIKVESPQALVRLGGYYELAATGAVKFEGPATGGNAAPIDTSLVHPGVALTGPPQSLTGPPQQLTSGVPVELYKPVGALTGVIETGREVRMTLAADILFDFDRATIRPDAQAALARVAEIIRTRSVGAVRIEGYTDAKGAPDYNLRLSNSRAASVRQWLADREGLRSSTFDVRGLGASRFVAPNTHANGADYPEGRQKNRRVEIVIQRKDS